MKCLRTVCCLLSLPLLLAGCQSSDEITTYQEDRPRKERLLGAILMQKDGQNWFFKFVAPEAVAEKHRAEVVKLYSSIKLEDKEDARPTWKLPEGWEEKEGGGQFRYKTLRLGPNKELELAVSFAGESLLANVNRWLLQESQSPAQSEKELRERKILQEVKVNDHTMYLVDITGTKAKRPPMGMAPGGPAPRGQGSKQEPKFDLPSGWKRVDPVDQFTLIALRLPDAPEGKPQVTITPFEKDGGGLLFNYQRWQGQLRLPKSSELPKDLKTIEVAGKQAHYFDLQGPAGKDQTRMLVVVVPHEQQTWFIKLWASPELVAKHQGDFEKFVKSVRF